MKTTSSDTTIALLCLGCKSWYGLCAWRASVFICTQYRLCFPQKIRCVFDRCKTWFFLSCHTCSSQVNNFVVFSGFFQSRSGNAWLHQCSSVLMWVWNVVLDLCQCSKPYSLRTTTSHSPHYSTCEAALYWNSSSFYSSFLPQISANNSARTTYIQSIQATSKYLP